MGGGGCRWRAPPLLPPAANRPLPFICGVLPRARAQPCSRVANLTGAGCGLAVTSGPDVFPGHAPGGVRRPRGAVTGKAYSTVTTRWKGRGSRVFVLPPSPKNSINSDSEQQAAGAGICLLFFSSSIGLPTLFGFRDKLGVIVTNKVWF